MLQQADQDVQVAEVYPREPHVQLEINPEPEDLSAPTRRQSSSTQNLPHLPLWLSKIISKSLGIKLREDEKPILACILYVITLTSALGFILTNWYFSAFDIVSDYTKTTVIDGTVSIIFNILWCALGIYANKLAYRLFSYVHLVSLIRLHSKTLLRMNAALLLLLLMTSFTVVSCIDGFRSSLEDVCTKVSLDVSVCRLRYIFRLIFSVFTLAWNYLVAFALISICRSHVIEIRKFMQILEKDSEAYEARYLGTDISHRLSAPLEEYSMVEEDYLEDLKEPPISRENRTRATDSSYSTAMTDSIPLSRTSPHGDIDAMQVSQSHDSRIKSKLRPSLTNDEILFRYWMIQTQLRRSSVALQRWMMSLISLVTVWLTMNLVMWLNYDPSLVDLANFLMPLLLLPLLSSAYAEVNQEGQRLLKFICLVEGRLPMLLVLQGAQLQMTVYGFSLSYSTIGTASLGVLLALASKVLIQKIFV